MKQEEKLEEAKRLYQTANADQRYVLESLFSELKESEGESMVKFIKNQLFNIKKTVTDNYELDAKLTKAIEWLEKQAQSTVIIIPKDLKGTDTDGGVVGEKGEQCEQKSADRSKFHEGDWITNGDYTWKIVGVKPLDYILQSQDGNIVDDTISHVDEQFHSFTIEDAKDGDVLVNGSNIFILHFINDTRLMGYCHVNTDDGRFYDDIGKYECFCLIDAVVNPATKKQRDILFQKMKDAGYEFDFEKKELKKIAQKPIVKVAPKFKVGDWVVCEVTGSVYQIKNCIESLSNHKYGYILTNGDYIGSDEVNHYHLWTIQDAKDSDVLAEDSCIFILKEMVNDFHAAITYCTLFNDGEFHDGETLYFDICSTKPATKEQCDALEKAMADAGYTFNFEKKELKKVENENYDGEEYGIDSLFHAQRILEKTLGKVDGYQTDDGILSHKCAIAAVKKLYEQTPAKWSEEDEEMLDNAVYACLNIYGKDSDTVDWLKSLKQRIRG